MKLPSRTAVYRAMIPRRSSADSASGLGSEVRRSLIARPTWASIAAIFGLIGAPFSLAKIGRGAARRHPPEVPTRVAPADDGAGRPFRLKLSDRPRLAWTMQ